MKQGLLKRWIDSIKRARGLARGRLRTPFGYMCGMGHLGDIFIQDHPDYSWMRMNGKMGLGQTARGIKRAKLSTLPDEVLEWAGIDAHDHHVVTNWNDGRFRLTRAEMMDELESRFS